MGQRVQVAAEFGPVVVGGRCSADMLAEVPAGFGKDMVAVVTAVLRGMLRLDCAVIGDAVDGS